MFLYSRENPIAGATTAYMGRNIMVKTKDPGIARTREVKYLVQNKRI